MTRARTGANLANHKQPDTDALVNVAELVHGHAVVAKCFDVLELSRDDGEGSEPVQNVQLLQKKQE